MIKLSEIKGDIELFDAFLQKAMAAPPEGVDIFEVVMAYNRIKTLLNEHTLTDE